MTARDSDTPLPDGVVLFEPWNRLEWCIKGRSSRRCRRWK